jgi:hypothetical protein
MFLPYFASFVHHCQCCNQDKAQLSDILLAFALAFLLVLICSIIGLFIRKVMG